ncbi:heterokaryon incompatibility protein-domain-containing protein [Nemania sp. FL0031]|nr:heterokaryon incompatibility protein-domain-containing protein [Nemania sp. FL0031]
MNLYSALRFLRYADHARALWVDALCINQDDDDERNHQVRLMNHIYSKAKQVIAWLGNVNGDAAHAIEAAGKDSTLHWSELLTMCDPLSIFGLLNNRWWKRVWTTQEAVLARVLTFQCGHISISWEIMLGALRSFNTHLSSTCCFELQRDWTTYHDNKLSFFMAIPDLLWLVPIQMGLEDLRLRKYSSSFCQAVLNFRYRDAPDPRDRASGNC